jgi:galactose mutarotase-like enzyme
MDPHPFGDSDAGPVQLVTLGREPGVCLEVLDLGATVHRLWVTGGDGARRNVVLGHPEAQDHLDSTHYLGSAIGRYANRIAGGRLTLDGAQVQLGAHDRGNHLHGGPDGFDRRVWTVADLSDDTVTLRLHSPDGDQGYPGNLDAEVRYRVSGDEVRVDFRATTDAPTPVNLTSHAYFNLDGEGSGTAEGHRLQVGAQEYLPVDDGGIPLGALESVDGTPFDLRTPTRIADAVRRRHPQVRASQGIDHNYALTGSGWRTVATLEAPGSRTRMELSTDQPGLQVYTGNFLDGTVPGTSGGLYRQGDGLALEPQRFPDSPNHPEFGPSVLRPGETYTAALSWRFSALA